MAREPKKQPARFHWRLTIGLVACGLTIGGLLVFARDFAAWPFLPFLGGAALVVAGALFGIGLVVYLLGGPRRKIKLRRLLRLDDPPR